MRLKTYDVKNLDYFNNMIVAACCLHNFTLDLPFELDDDREHQNELNDDFDLQDEDVNEELDDRAIEKRNTIAAYYAEILEESEGEEEQLSHFIHHYFEKTKNLYFEIIDHFCLIKNINMFLRLLFKHVYRKTKCNFSYL